MLPEFNNLPAAAGVLSQLQEKLTELNKDRLKQMKQVEMMAISLYFLSKRVVWRWYKIASHLQGHEERPDELIVKYVQGHTNMDYNSPL